MSSVKLDPISVIEADLGIEPNGKVHAFFTELCYKKMDRFVPKDIGNLRRIVSLDIDSITYESEYAEAQYKGMTHGKPIEHYTTVGTGAYWDERMKAVEMDNIIKEVSKKIGE